MKNALATVGVCQLAFTLFLAWVMIAYGHWKLSWVVDRIKNYRELVRAHLDYLLMALFLLVFAALERTIETPFSPWLVGLTCYGTTVNPLGFLLPALDPELDQKPFFSSYKLLLYSGFVATSAGLVGLGAQFLCRIS